VIRLVAKVSVFIDYLGQMKAKGEKLVAAHLAHLEDEKKHRHVVTQHMIEMERHAGRVELAVRGLGVPGKLGPEDLTPVQAILLNQRDSEASGG
jgi:hypothetical protein